MGKLRVRSFPRISLLEQFRRERESSKRPHPQSARGYVHLLNGWVWHPEDEGGGRLEPDWELERSLEGIDGGFHGAINLDLNPVEAGAKDGDEEGADNAPLLYGAPLRPSLSSPLRTRPTAELVLLVQSRCDQSGEAFAELYHRFRKRLTRVVSRLLKLEPGDRWPAGATVWIEEGLFEAVRKFMPKSISARAEAYLVKYAERAVRSRVVDAHRAARPWVSLHEPDEDGDVLVDRLADAALTLGADEPPTRFPWEGRIPPRDLVLQLRTTVAADTLERRLLDALMPPPPEDPEARRHHSWYSNLSLESLPETVGASTEDILGALNRLQEAAGNLIPAA